MKRNEQKIEDTWCMEDIFSSDEIWEQEFAQLQTEMRKYTEYSGTLCQSSDRLCEYLKYNDKMNLILERLYVYAQQKYHQDMADGKYQDYSARVSKVMVEMGSLSSFAEPEILEMDEQKIEQLLKENESLTVYKRYLSEIFRQKKHTLDKKTEAILSKSQQIANAANDIYSMYNGADIKFPTIKDENGNDVEITHGNFVPLMESNDRGVRENAFKAVYGTYGKMRNTLSATYSANLDQAQFYADVRGFSSARAMYLYGSNVPETVYDNLIESVHNNMDKMYKYIDIREKAMDVDRLHMYDLYTPIVKAPTKRYSFYEAKQMVLKGLKPMGKDYLDKLEEGFNNRWIDIYENEGKRSGAYSWGAYGTHPYVLLNFQGTLDHVFTLAHEMGHALHSYYSDVTQPYVNAGYKIFVAEVASTCNESLLMQSMLDETTDKDERAYLINHFLDKIKGTLYRQTMFAEFEKITHEMVGKGESVTADKLCEIYYGLNKLYFGENIVLDKEIELEWARIPHFYRPFYVYQYATGISAAIALSRKILKDAEAGVKDYMRFLTGGGSLDPIDLLKLAGVDMSKKEPIDMALQMFGELVDELETLL